MPDTSNVLGPVLTAPNFAAPPPVLTVEIDYSTNLSQADYAASIKADSPRLYYRLNESTIGSGTAMVATAGQNGSYIGNGSTYPTPNQAGPITVDTGDDAVRFVTGGGYANSVSMNSGARYQWQTAGRPSLDEMTLEFWVKPHSLPTVDLDEHTWVSLFLSTGGPAIFGAMNAAGAVRGYTFVSDDVATIGAWTHVVFTRETGTEILYLNGLEVHRGEFAASGTEITLLRIGGPSGNTLDATLDEVALYQHGLDAARVSAHYQARISTAQTTNVWTNESSRLLNGSISIRHGRNDELSRIEANRFQIPLDNTDRVLEPENAASPRYPNVIPMRQIRLTALRESITYPLARGVIEEWNPNRISSRRAVVRPDCLDQYEFFGRVNLASTAVPIEKTGARINRLLDFASHPASLRAIDAGAETMHGEVLSGPLLNHLLEAAATEAVGLFFLDDQGRAVFHDRLHRTTQTRSTVSQATFGDGTGELPYLRPVPGFGVKDVYNEARITPTYGDGAVEQVAIDKPSQDKYGRRVYNASLKLNTNAAALAAAQRIVAGRKTPRYRYRALTIEPMRSEALWAIALGAQLSDRVTVNERPQGGTLVSRACFIEGVSHDIAFGARLGWQTSFLLSLV